MNKIISILMLSVMMFVSTYASSDFTTLSLGGDTGEEFGRDVSSQEINPQAQQVDFTSSTNSGDTGEEFGREVTAEEINPQAQQIQFDPSRAQEDTGEEFGREVTTEEINDLMVLEEVEDINNVEEIQENSQKITDNIVFVAGFGIIVISLIGITILYSLYHFRRKRGLE